VNPGLRRLLSVIRKEMVQRLRDWPTLVLILAVPVIELFLFAYVGDMILKDIPTAVADMSKDARSRALIDALQASGSFDVQTYVASQEEAVRAIDEGLAGAAVVIPPGLGADMERDRAQALVILDGSDPFMVQSGYNAAQAIGQAYGMELLVERAERMGMPDVGELPVETSTRILYNPNIDQLIFLIPGIAGILLQVLAVNQMTMSVVRERELGTLEQLLITPLRPIELMIGKIVPSILISLAELAVILVLGVYWFGVPFRGSVRLFVMLALVFIVSGLGLGLMMSTFARTQRQAQQMSTVLMVLSMLMTGLVYPRSTMPPVIRAFGNLIPATYFIRIARGIVTKGVGLRLVWNDVLVLLAYAAVTMVLSAVTFKRRLD
jgi:ABC-2 type transport system permease protein